MCVCGLRVLVVGGRRHQSRQPSVPFTLHQKTPHTHICPGCFSCSESLLLTPGRQSALAKDPHSLWATPDTSCPSTRTNVCYHTFAHLGAGLCPGLNKV